MGNSEKCNSLSEAPVSKDIWGRVKDGAYSTYDVFTLLKKKKNDKTSDVLPILKSYQSEIESKIKSHRDDNLNPGAKLMSQYAALERESLDEKDMASPKYVFRSSTRTRWEIFKNGI